MTSRIEGHPQRIWSQPELARMRTAVEGGEILLEDICKRFKCSRHTIEAFIRERGWRNPQAVRAYKKPSKPAGKRKAYSLANSVADARREVERGQRNIYGILYDDMVLLRRRDWVVTKEPGGFLVGNKLMSAVDMHAVAERERRLAGISA